jgi:hypothetical protein
VGDEFPIRSQATGDLLLRDPVTGRPVALGGGRIGASVARRVTLNGRSVRHEERRTNRGLEVNVAAPAGSAQALVVTTR